MPCVAAAGLVVGMSIVIAPFVGSAAAQDGDVEVIIARKVLIAPGGEIPFPIHIRNTNALPKNSFLRIRGDLSGFRFSQGHSVSQSAWAIPIGSLSQLTIRLMTALAKPRRLRVLLVALDGNAFRSFAMADVTLYGIGEDIGAGQTTTSETGVGTDAPKSSTADNVQRRAPPQASAAIKGPPLPVATGSAADGDTQPSQETAGSGNAADDQDPPSKTANPNSRTERRTALQSPPKPAVSRAENTVSTPKMSASQKKTAEALLARGQGLLERGQVESARLFFRRSARLGLAAAAMAMASTYDPERLNAIGAFGLVPDPDAARTWYERARDLGASEASSRLGRLQNTFR